MDTLILGVLELYRLPGWNRFSYRARNEHPDASGNTQADAPQPKKAKPKAASND